MITSLHLRNFKRFESLDVLGFSKVNLIAGKNNCGKTGLLEAILLAATKIHIQHAAHTFRRTDGQSQGRPFEHWFARSGSAEWETYIVCAPGEVHSRIMSQNFNIPKRTYAELGGLNPVVTEEGGAYVMNRWSVNAVAIPSWPLTVEDEAVEFDRMILRKQEKTFEARLRSVEPKLESVRALQPDSKRVLFADVGLPEMIPLSLLGQGVLRLTSIFIRALGAKADILLIDEIENGLHHGALLELWKGLKELSDKEGTQIFATTHSMECIAAASQVFGAGQDAGLSFHRIEDVKGVPTAISINAERLASVLETGFEIR